MTTTTVSFNEEDQKFFDEIKSAGLTTRKFSQFVREAYLDAIEEHKARQVDLTKETIERLAFEAVQRETQKAIKQQ